MAKPRLIVVSGPSGVGKTTLAHRLAEAIKCPAICRDEIKEGLVHAADEYVASPGDDLTVQASKLFFAVLETLVRGGATVVAEAAFQDKVWRPNLAPFADVAELRVLHCHTDPRTAADRARSRGRREAHTEPTIHEAAGYHRDFDRVELQVPSLDVDTTSDYSPTLDEIVDFVNV